MKQITKILTIAMLAFFVMPAFAQNDLCGNATPISCGDTVAGSTVGATADGVGTCGTSNTAPGVWYKVVGTGSTIIASTCSQASYDTKISVFSGACGALTCVSGNDDFCGLRSQVEFPTTAGADYFILVHGFSSATGTFNLSVTCLVPLVNDAPCNATALTLGESIEYNNVGATADVGEVSPGPGTGSSSCNSQDGWCSFEIAVQNSVWFKFEVPPSGAVSIDAPGYDNQLAVWSATDCSDYTSYTEIGANDDSGPVFAAFLELYCLTPGEALLVQLDGYNGSTTNGATITLSDLGGESLTADAGGCQTKFLGYEPAAGLNYLSASASGGSAPYAFSWSGDGITTNANFATVSVDPIETTTYTVTVTDANGCTAESTVVVNVVDLICDDNENKITLCHIPIGNEDNPQQICVNKNAVEAHLAHGDVLGFCGNECTATNPEPPACVDVSIEITTDRFASETSWELTSQDGAVIASGARGSLSNSTTTTLYSGVCVPAGCYTFTIFDSFGDGICCVWGEGKYAITYDGVVTESPSGGAFDSSESVSFGSCEGARQLGSKDVTIGNTSMGDIGEISVFPNPFSSRAQINYIPSMTGNATIDVYTINGTLVSRILDVQVKRGEAINAEVLGSQLGADGIYIYQLRIADKVFSGKLVYMK